MRCRNNPGLVSSPALVLLAFAGAAIAQPSITSIGPGTGISMSADGNTVVGVSDNAYRWTRSGGSQTLGVLTGYTASQGNGVSGDGNVAVGFSYGGIEPSAGFRWTSAGGMQNIGTLPGGTSTFASVTNFDGSVVAGYSVVSSNERAFRWTAAGGMADIGTLPGDSQAESYGISADGNTIVGISIRGNFDSNRPFRWTSTGGMQRLGVIPGDGDGAVFTSGVSADGRFVAGNGDTAAVRWDATGTPQDLGLLPGFDYAYTSAISGDGSAILGGLGTFTGQPGANFLWTEQLGMVDLATYLPAIGVNLTGWNFDLASFVGLSYDGSSILGYGATFNGESNVSFVISGVPAPGAASILALFGLAAVRRRR